MSTWLGLGLGLGLGIGVGVGVGLGSELESREREHVHRRGAVAIATRHVDAPVCDAERIRAEVEVDRAPVEEEAVVEKA